MVGDCSHEGVGRGEGEVGCDWSKGPNRGTEAVPVAPTRGSVRSCAPAALPCRGIKTGGLLPFFVGESVTAAVVVARREGGVVELLSSGMWGISASGWYLGGCWDGCDWGNSLRRG